MKRLALVVTLLAVAACADDGPLTAPPDPTPAARPQAVDLTPFQQSIRSRFAERAAGGLPTPDVSFSTTSDNGVPLSALQGYAGVPGDSFTVVATTTIRFANPGEAGLERWPSTVIVGEIPPEEGMIREGDYDDDVRSYVAERIPGFWQRHEFGHEPRTRKITETITVTYATSAPSDFARSVVEDDLVHGFTFVGPNIDWTVGDELCVFEDTGIEVCAWKIRAGFAMDWGFGMRLPMNVSLSAADAVDEGEVFTPTSLADGADWSAEDYTAAGIAAESGNEFVMRYEFFLGAQVEIAEVSVVDIGPDIDENRSSSFKTPFGSGAVFDLPTIDVPLVTRSLAVVVLEFGAAITPQAGSDKFRANWMATSGLLGNGALTYTDPGTAEDLASVLAVDGPSAGNLQIKDTKYVFNQYKIALGAYFQIDIIDIFDFRYGIPITDFDLSNLIPDISVPIHPGASPTTLNSGVTVLNVAPTAAIDVAGAQIINGADVFFADIGEAIPFQGASHDPGLDDLVLAWSFGDGTPDISTPYPLPAVATTGPNDAFDSQPHAFAQACIYPVTLTSTDSDGASRQDGAFAIIRSAANDQARLAGYWQHQFRMDGSVDFAEDELGCLLAIVSATSTVFDEERDASTAAAALTVVRLNGNQGSELEKLDRELLVAWMNFANGVFDLGDLVDTDLDDVPDTPFGAALAGAEAVRLNPSATQRELQSQREIVHDIVAQGT